VLLVGSGSQFTVMMDYVTRGQITSLFMALGVISVLLSLVPGSLKTGLIAMIPNPAPALATDYFVVPVLLSRTSVHKTIDDCSLCMLYHKKV
jgi:predicted RND superfamily exporter protein